MRRIEIAYKIFKLVRFSNTREGVYQNLLELVNHEEYQSENAANDWILNNGDHRTLAFDYVILECRRVVQDQSV